MTHASVLKFRVGDPMQRNPRSAVQQHPTDKSSPLPGRSSRIIIRVNHTYLSSEGGWQKCIDSALSHTYTSKGVEYAPPETVYNSELDWCLVWAAAETLQPRRLWPAPPPPPTNASCMLTNFPANATCTWWGEGEGVWGYTTGFLLPHWAPTALTNTHIHADRLGRVCARYVCLAGCVSLRSERDFNGQITTNPGRMLSRRLAVGVSRVLELCCV